MRSHVTRNAFISPEMNFDPCGGHCGLCMLLIPKNTFVLDNKSLKERKNVKKKEANAVEHELRGPRDRDNSLNTYMNNSYHLWSRERETRERERIMDTSGGQAADSGTQMRHTAQPNRTSVLLQTSPHGFTQPFVQHESP